MFKNVLFRPWVNVMIISFAWVIVSALADCSGPELQSSREDEGGTYVVYWIDFKGALKKYDLSFTPGMFRVGEEGKNKQTLHTDLQLSPTHGNISALWNILSLKHHHAGRCNCSEDNSPKKRLTIKVRNSECYWNFEALNLFTQTRSSERTNVFCSDTVLCYPLL